MHPNEALIERLYSAFARNNSDTMNACYSPMATFEDPAFGRLNHRELTAMWRMLTSNAKDLQVTFGDITADDVEGRCHWEARYTLSSTGRPVHNVIDARFKFHDGLIVEHVDSFDFSRWMVQAMGFAGWLATWLPPLRAQVRQNVRRRLETYMATH